MVELAAALHSEGRTLLDALAAIYAEFGLHATSQLSVRMDRLEDIRGAVSRLRERPPAELAGRTVVAVDDLALGVDGLPPTDGVRLRLLDGHVIVRPSGTEPKLKCYLELVTPANTNAVERAAAVLNATKEALRATLGL